MVRAICLLVMTGGFLVISPNLRDSLVGGLTQASNNMALYSPISYIGLGFCLVLFLMFLLYKASQPR